MFDLATRWAFPDLRRQMDRVFEQVMEPNGGFPSLRAFPALNVWEDNDCVFVEAELPGVAMNDIEINVVGGELSIKGSRRPMSTGAMGNGNVTYHRQERATGEFSRFLTLPDAIDADKVDGCLKNGVLSIKLPKAEAAKPRRIPVNAR